MSYSSRIVLSCMVATVALVVVANPRLGAQSRTSHPGILLATTAGHVAYHDDSGSTGRREFRMRAGYRVCMACDAIGARVRLMPFISLGITDLAGLSHRRAGDAAVSSLDAGTAVVIDVTRAWRAEVAGAVGLRSTTERLSTPLGVTAPARDFVNLSGQGALRFAVQLERTCVPFPLLGRRSLIAGVSSARGRYDTVEVGGESLPLAHRTAHRSTSIWIGLQSRLLQSDCGGA